MNKYLLSILALMLSMSIASAAPNPDGDPSEWGPAGFLTGDWQLNETWLPSNGVRFIVEDNRDPKYPITDPTHVYYPGTGVHIQGIGTSYNSYDEPKVTHKDGYPVVEPYGYEPFDLEAMYFQQDTENVYLLIVTSLKQDGSGIYAPGDLRIDITPATSEDGKRWEYGVKIGTNTGLNQFGLYQVKKWGPILPSEPDYIPENLPVRIAEGNLIADLSSGSAAYVKCSNCNNNAEGKDYGHSNYIIELKIPKSALGITGTANFGSFQATDNCTNDVIIPTPIPEFALVAMPIAAIIGLVFVLRNRRKEQ